MATRRTFSARPPGHSRRTELLADCLGESTGCDRENAACGSSACQGEQKRLVVGRYCVGLFAFQHLLQRLTAAVLGGIAQEAYDRVDEWWKKSRFGPVDGKRRGTVAHQANQRALLDIGQGREPQVILPA